MKQRKLSSSAAIEQNAEPMKSVEYRQPSPLWKCFAMVVSGYIFFFNMKYDQLPYRIVCMLQTSIFCRNIFKLADEIICMFFLIRNFRSKFHNFTFKWYFHLFSSNFDINTLILIKYPAGTFDINHTSSGAAKFRNSKSKVQNKHLM